MATIEWEEVSTSTRDERLQRATIPGGWLLKVLEDDFVPDSGGGHHEYSVAVIFIPDPDHTWDGGSLP